MARMIDVAMILVKWGRGGGTAKALELMRSGQRLHFVERLECWSCCLCSRTIGVHHAALQVNGVRTRRTGSGRKNAHVVADYHLSDDDH